MASIQLKGRPLPTWVRKRTTIQRVDSRSGEPTRYSARLTGMRQFTGTQHLISAAAWRGIARFAAASLVTLLLAGALTVTSSLPAWACSCMAPSAESVVASEGTIIGTVTGITFAELAFGDRVTVYTVEVDVDAFDNVDDSVSVGVFDDSCFVSFSIGDMISTTLSPLYLDDGAAVATGSCSTAPPDLIAQAADLERTSPRGARIDIGEGVPAEGWLEAMTDPNSRVEGEQPAAVPVPADPSDELLDDDGLFLDEPPMPVDAGPEIAPPADVAPVDVSGNDGTGSTTWIVIGGAILIATITAAAFLVDRNLRSEGR